MIETVTWRTTKELKCFLKTKAKEQGLTLNALISQILWQYFETKKEI